MRCAKAGVSHPRQRGCKRTVAVLTALVVTLVAGCASEPRVAPIRPPAALLQDCPIPMLPPFPVNKDLAALVVDQKASLLSCNADKQALREWANSIKE